MVPGYSNKTTDTESSDIDGKNKDMRSLGGFCQKVRKSEQKYTDAKNIVR